MLKVAFYEVEVFLIASRFTVLLTKNDDSFSKCADERHAKAPFSYALLLPTATRLTLTSYWVLSIYNIWVAEVADFSRKKIL